MERERNKKKEWRESYEAGGMERGRERWRGIRWRNGERERNKEEEW